MPFFLSVLVKHIIVPPGYCVGTGAMSQSGLFAAKKTHKKGILSVPADLPAQCYREPATGKTADLAAAIRKLKYLKSQD